MLRFILTLMKLKRLFQIGIVLVKYASSELLDHSIFMFKRRKRHVKREVYSTPQRIRQTIEELGPTYVKFGQILADRPDVVSDKFRVELKKLQSKAEPFDTQVAINIIENSFGKSIDELFRVFDKEPIAAASIGQVYRATLNSGEEVVVKVQRPIIENKIKMDIYLMKFLAKKLAYNYPELTAINVVGLVDEFSQNMMRELDYNNETSNVNIFSRMFSGSTTIKIPKVYEQFSTKHIIVMEFIDGETPDDREHLAALGFDNKQIVINGTDAIFKMIFEYGVFHADPHPGNLFVLKGNVVAFIDFGMVGILRPREMNFLADFIIGYVKKDGAMIARALLVLCDLKYYDKSDELIFSIHQMLIRNFGAKKMELKKFSGVMQDSIDILIKFNLQVPSGIFLLMKAIATLEKFAESLSSDLDLAPIVTPYAKALIEERYSAKKMASDFKTTMRDYVDFFKTLPNNLTEILVKFKEGKIRHDIKIEDDALFVKTARQISLRIAYTILLIGLFIGATILIVWDSEQKFGYFILYLSSTLILLLLVRWLFIRR